MSSSSSPSNTGVTGVSNSTTILSPLPPSPSSSTSSLTSEEETFDHLAPVPSPVVVSLTTRSNGRSDAGADAIPTPTLGLRDLVRMHKMERKNSSAATGAITTSTTPAPAATPSTTNQVQITVAATAGAGDDEAPPYADSNNRGEVFARQVVIRGWKVVGGKSWTDMGKIGAYVVYDIDIGLQNGGNINILRRYTDFVKLRSALKSRYPQLEAAIPPLPGRAHISKFSEKFLKDRQPRLQRFLKGVILHPVMGKGGEGSVVGQWVIGPTSEVRKSLV
ncbi:hypothetical protein IAR55_000847 [Kwoniella newhampshirensis]|uniref:Endosomal/vacuolar adapter protein YPT35 n=1 Tax=Kwoniella newhampshirensis TaxID=1651941 RepID=A0AAW0Z4L3_9TREE